MNAALRMFLAVVAGLASYMLTMLMLSVLLESSLPGFVLWLLAACAGICGGRYTWLTVATAPTSLHTGILTGALVVGGLGFALGFFGPMIFAPQANQGPLLGIFITGPLGAVLGAVGGALRWQLRKR